MSHKAGYVNIIGNPNVGKSTLMNQLVGEKLSIITSKSQTTRHRILGIVNGEDFQIVYSDTPGILKPNYKLQESMMRFVDTALIDADVIVYVTDIYETIDKNMNYIDKVNKVKAPVILVVNKIDQSNQDELEEKVELWKQYIPKALVIPMSAKANFNVDVLFKNILEFVPESPPYFPKDALTDKTERFFVQEILREKVLVHYKKEIPYSVEMEVESFKEDEKQIHIQCVIYVARESQKGIIIGHQGRALKRVGTEARLDMEEFFGKKVFLETFVKVNKDWRDNDRQLKRFGYEQ